MEKVMVEEECLLSSVVCTCTTWQHLPTTSNCLLTLMRQCDGDVPLANAARSFLETSQLPRVPAVGLECYSEYFCVRRGSLF